MSKKNKIGKYFEKLVQIDSPSGSENEVCSYLDNWLKDQGFNTYTDGVGNLFASKNVSENHKPPLLLCAHMDTVQPGIGIKPFLHNGVYKSTGNTILGADNKSSVTAIMVAIEDFYRKKNNKTKPLELLFTVKEETGGGIDNFDLSKISAKRVLVCDYAKPIGTIVLGAPFIQNFTIEFFGKAVHSSKPDNGINAFVGLSELLQKVKVGSLDYGYSTINIGIIEGGSSVNTVPEKCIVKGEIRSFKKILFNKHIKNVENVSKKVAKKNNLVVGFSVDGYCPGYLYNEDSQHIIEAAKVIKSNTSEKIKFEKTFGVSDANILASAGFKTILISDGVRNPHTVKESIAVDDMILLEKIVLKFLENY